jgi:hypothetical protein
MSAGSSYLFKNADEFQPSPSEMKGQVNYNVMSHVAKPGQNIRAEPPLMYLGHYPVTQADHFTSIWATPCQK